MSKLVDRPPQMNETKDPCLHCANKQRCATEKMACNLFLGYCGEAEFKKTKYKDRTPSSRIYMMLFEGDYDFDLRT